MAGQPFHAANRYRAPKPLSSNLAGRIYGGSGDGGEVRGNSRGVRGGTYAGTASGLLDLLIFQDVSWPPGYWQRVNCGCADQGQGGMS